MVEMAGLRWWNWLVCDGEIGCFYSSANTRSMSRKGTCPDNARAEGFFGTLKQEFLYGREWAGVGREEFEGLLSGYMGWYVGRRPRRFREGGRARYETLAEHRRRLGYPVPPFAAQQAQ